MRECPPSWKKLSSEPTCGAAENLRPEPRNDLLDRRAHTALFGAQSDLLLAALERPAVELAVGRQRQRVQDHERRWHHGLGKLPAQMPAELLGLEPRARTRHDVGDQTLLPCLRSADDDGALPHSAVAAQSCPDLGGLDAHSADLHLLVETAQNLQRAIQPVSSAVAGEVEQVVGAAEEGVGTETQPALLGVVEIAEAAERSPQNDFADLTEPAEPFASGSENQGLGLRNRPLRPAVRRRQVGQGPGRSTWRGWFPWDRRG